MTRAALALILVVSACTTDATVGAEPPTTTAAPTTSTLHTPTTTTADLEALMYEAFLAVATFTAPELDWTTISQADYINEIYRMCSLLDVESPEAVAVSALADLMSGAPDDPAENAWYERLYTMFVGTALSGAARLCPRHAGAIDAWFAET